MKPCIVTIGVYGFDRDRFFSALLHANIDTFCDIRARRGMRGSTYTFVNSLSLQQRLTELGIRYVHVKDLAPSRGVREVQRLADQLSGRAKRERTGLSQQFIQSYTEECLASLDSRQFLAQLGEEAKTIALFCVEREPQSCHRSLVVQRLAQDLGLQVEHIMS